MKTKARTFLLALIFLLPFSGSSVSFADDFKDALDALDREDYETLHKLTLPLAEKGNAKAQYILGGMYSEGVGVPQDYKEAARWSKIAAEQGLAEAQYNLGLMYYHGEGIPQDYVLAYMWWNLSGSQGQQSARENRDILEEEMTQQQVAKAQEMARHWKSKK